MTTATFVTALAHTDNTTFRAWGGELSTQLAAVGLVKTSDTGQIDWATVSRPSANTAAGYEIWRFNDSLQGTAPIFLKLEYGTGPSATYPQLWLTVGTASNGSGTLTGTVSSRDVCAYNGGPSAGNWPSFLCVAAGFFGLIWKQGSCSSNGYAFMAVARTHDTNGAPTANGFMVYWGAAATNTAGSTQCVRTAATATVFTVSNLFSIIPAQVTGSLVGSDLQIYAHYGIDPRVWVSPVMATVILSEIPAAATFQVAMVGSTARTFLSIGAGYRAIVVGAGPGSISTYGLAMLWE